MLNMTSTDALHCLNRYVLIPITFSCRFLLVLIMTILLRRLYLGRKSKTCTIVVLGDIGRSPRMQYHALSLARHGFRVDMVGYGDSTPHQKILENDKIFTHSLTKERISGYFPRMPAYFVKVILQSIILSWKLVFEVRAAEFLMIQNPPCIPAMLVCWMVTIFNGTKFVIDWHNYGYTILGLTLGKGHRLVKFAHTYEKTLGQLSSRDICVTDAMREDLQKNWHVHAVVLYDRPPEHFRPLEKDEQHALFMRLKDEYKVFGPASAVEHTTAFTAMKGGVVTKLKDRPALIISSTSWTEDEDFSILLNALKLYDSTKSETPEGLPDVICAITGKGPMKDHYLGEISKIDWKHVKIVTPWLTAEDYPLLVGSSDLGVCLHTSSSGLDLPMKVVDMFGCGVPVAAVGFECLHELVKDGVNGVIFHNENELHKQLCDLLAGFPEKQQSLTEMRKNLTMFRQSTWSKNWDDNVWPLFQS